MGSRGYSRSSSCISGVGACGCKLRRTGRLGVFCGAAGNGRGQCVHSSKP